MVATRKTRSSRQADTADASEPSTSPHADFVPPKKGGRHALRKKKEPSPANQGQDPVSMLLHDIAEQLKTKGLASPGGSDGSWTHAKVKDSLKRALGLLPAGLQQALQPDDEDAFDKHVVMLLGLLGGHVEGVQAKKQKRGTAKSEARRRPSATATTTTVCDETLEAMFSSKKSPSAEACAAAVMARVPASAAAMHALCASRDPEYVLQACTATGGLCEQTDMRVAAFSVFADLVANGRVEEPLMKMAVSSVHTLIEGSRQRARSLPGSVWTMWGADHHDATNASAKACATCYQLVRALVTSSLDREPVTEDTIGNNTKYAGHLMYLLSPYAALGLLRHVQQAKSASSSDLVMFLALLSVGGPTQIEVLADSHGISGPAIYLLYLYLSRRAVAAAEAASLVTLSHQLKQKASATTPPESITEWLEDQPPSSTIQLLIEKAGQGLPELSAYIVDGMREEDLHALASLSLAGVGEEKAPADIGETRGAMDDLLFFESTEGALNVFPEDWDDGDDVEVDVNSE